MSAAPARVFVGLPLGADLGARVAARVAPTLPRGAWRSARPEGLHATLAFLGAIERGRLPGLFERLGKALAGARGPRLWLVGTGAFPGPERPSVLWVGAKERADPGRLAACREAVVSALQAGGVDLGEELRRPFRPHVTVARPRGRARLPEAFRALALGEAWDPEVVVFFESRLDPGGSRYVALERWPFSP